MKVSVNKRGYTLSGISAETLNTVMYLLGTAKDRCFTDNDYQSYVERYFYSGDFVASIDKKQRENLHNFVDGFWAEYEVVKVKLFMDYA